MKEEKVLETKIDEALNKVSGILDSFVDTLSTNPDNLLGWVEKSKSGLEYFSRVLKEIGDYQVEHICEHLGINPTKLTQQQQEYLERGEIEKCYGEIKKEKVGEVIGILNQISYKKK